jgi:hypothetical protein
VLSKLYIIASPQFSKDFMSSPSTCVYKEHFFSVCVDWGCYWLIIFLNNRLVFWLLTVSLYITFIEYLVAPGGVPTILERFKYALTTSIMEHRLTWHLYDETEQLRGVPETNRVEYQLFGLRTEMPDQHTPTIDTLGRRLTTDFRSDWQVVSRLYIY